MYCSQCGEKIATDEKYCSNCGKPTTRTEEKLEHQSDKIGRWSWGAFGLSWIYLSSMKYKWWWAFLILMGITNGLSKSSDIALSWIGIIIQLAIMIVLGIEGRKIAYENRKWESREHFLKVQRIWDIWGVVFTVLIFIVYFIIGLMVLE